MKRSPTRRRSFVLVAVMVVAGSALFIGTSLMYALRSDAAIAANANETMQARALAWSGVQLVVAELHRQRDRILEGRSPQLDGEYVIYESLTETGVVRVLPVGPSGERLVSEAGKLDLNTVDAETLEATGLVDPATAESIIEYRDGLGRPIQSVAELLNASGVTAELLYGPFDSLKYTTLAQGADADVGEALLSAYDSGIVRGLADAVTVYAFEPALQRNGRLRIDLNVKWSDELRDRVAERFDEQIAEGLSNIYESGFTFDSEAKLFALLRNFDVDPTDWREATDVFTAEPFEYHKGRVDLNTAPYEVLLALPAIEPDQAQQCLDLRDSLSSEDRASIAWPAIAEVVAPEAYEELAGRITTRSWTWRVVLAAGVIAADDPDSALGSVVIYEVVVDLSAPRPRLAYLRDVSLMEAAALLADEFAIFEDVEVDDREIDSTSEDDRSATDEPDDPGPANTRTREPEPRDVDDEIDDDNDVDRDEDRDDSDVPRGDAPRRVGRWRAGG